MEKRRKNYQHKKLHDLRAHRKGFNLSQNVRKIGTHHPSTHDMVLYNLCNGIVHFMQSLEDCWKLRNWYNFKSFMFVQYDWYESNSIIKTLIWNNSKEMEICELHEQVDFLPGSVLHDLIYLFAAGFWIPPDPDQVKHAKTRIIIHIVIYKIC